MKTEQCNKSEVRQQRGSVSEKTRKRILIVEQNCRNSCFAHQKSLIFDEEGGARKRPKFSLKVGTEVSGLCDDAVRVTITISRNL